MRPNDNFQALFRQLLTDCDLTMREAATFLLMSKNTVDNWANGRNAPSSELMAEAVLTKLRNARSIIQISGAPRKIRRGRKAKTPE